MFSCRVWIKAIKQSDYKCKATIQLTVWLYLRWGHARGVYKLGKLWWTGGHTHVCAHTPGRLGNVEKVEFLQSYLCLLVSSCQLKVEVSAREDNRWDSFHVVKCTQDTNACLLFLPQDKRRIQENIAMKRRQIEEEKLKLQYIKVLFTVVRACAKMCS